METIKNSPLTVFLSYAHEDEAMKERLDVHLASLIRSNKVDIWHDRKIMSGTEWDSTIKSEILKADIILLLISADFLASDYIWKVELAKAMDRHQKKEAIVIPIFLKPCDWQEMPFSIINGLPKNARPVSSFEDRDEAYLEVSKGIRNVVEHINQKKS